MKAVATALHVSGSGLIARMIVYIFASFPPLFSTLVSWFLALLMPCLWPLMPPVVWWGKAQWQPTPPPPHVDCFLKNLHASLAGWFSFKFLMLFPLSMPDATLHFRMWGEVAAQRRQHWHLTFLQGLPPHPEVAQHRQRRLLTLIVIFYFQPHHGWLFINVLAATDKSCQQHHLLIDFLSIFLAATLPPSPTCFRRAPPDARGGGGNDANALSSPLITSPQVDWFFSVCHATQPTVKLCGAPYFEHRIAYSLTPRNKCFWDNSPVDCCGILFFLAILNHVAGNQNLETFDDEQQVAVATGCTHGGHAQHLHATAQAFQTRHIRRWGWLLWFKRYLWHQLTRPRKNRKKWVLQKTFVAASIA